MILNKLFLLILISCLFCSCGKSDPSPKPVASDNDMVVGSEVLVPSFVGNGVQWGGYDLLLSWTGSATLSSSDWEKLFLRVGYMRPPLVRLMVSPGWNYMVDGQFAPEKSEDVLCKILDFCEQQNIDVIIGEWGHQGGSEIDRNWLENAAKFVDWLLNTKNYTCIQYYNMVNEPNGDWSSIKGNYTLWKTLLEQFHQKLVAKNLASRLELIGPDIAIWDVALTGWVLNTQNDLGDKVTTYDIHTYPDETIVRSGNYQTLVKSYRNNAPATAKMIMGELGFKYKATSDLGIENSRRISADKYASDDSNMFTYDAFYGVDVADAIIQNMRAGYAGNILWDLDDAMYDIDGSGTKLKRWGFWNILGREKFENDEDENIRPWFYPASLLCRYFPRQTKIMNVTLPDKYGLRAITGELNGKYTIAIVNSHTVDYSINLKAEDGLVLQNADVYKYNAGSGSDFEGEVDGSGFPVPDLENQAFDFSNVEGYELNIPAQSFMLITNIN